MEQPAFRRLLAAVYSRSIGVVVVHRVDRLGRSLLDFAKVVERFEASDVSFVSVTQNFSTADAMGRLTLNMLMSFAEFEREMIGERTRDKTGAARRKTWSTVQALLAGGTGPRRDHGRRADYFLRGILRCACCGSAFTPASTRKGSMSTGTTGACEGRRRGGVPARPRRFRRMRSRARGCRARSRLCPPREYGSVWDVLTPASRGRLVRAIVERVEVDEPKNEVRVFLTDLQPAPREAVA